MCGRWIENKGSGHRVFFLDGALIEERLIRAVAALLKGRYGVVLHLDFGFEKGAEMGMLASLSNSGTALMREEEAFEWRWKAKDAREESLSLYLREKFGVTWSLVFKELVREAEGIADGEELNVLPKRVEEVAEVIRMAEELRAELVGRAIAHETAGASLSWICAFKLALMGNGTVGDELLEGFPEQYGEVLEEARGVIQKLEQGCVQGIREKR